MDEPAISQQRIREVAYLLWETAGKPEGSPNRYWEQAERQLKGETDQSTREPSAAEQKEK